MQMIYVLSVTPFGCSISVSRLCSILSYNLSLVCSLDPVPFDCQETYVLGCRRSVGSVHHRPRVWEDLLCLVRHKQCRLQCQIDYWATMNSKHDLSAPSISLRVRHGGRKQVPHSDCWQHWGQLGSWWEL